MCRRPFLLLRFLHNFLIDPQYDILNATVLRERRMDIVLQPCLILELDIRYSKVILINNKIFSNYSNSIN